LTVLGSGVFFSGILGSGSIFFSGSIFCSGLIFGGTTMQYFYKAFKNLLIKVILKTLLAYSIKL
jgi:hypothetical protein